MPRRRMPRRQPPLLKRSARMYTDYYKLRAEPFLLTPDERFYFESSVHAQAMAHLIYGLKRGEGFIVITGDVGAGKTTLVKRLIAKIDPNKVIAAHVVTTMLSGHDLLRMVAAALGLRDLPADKSGVLLRLQNFFEATHRQGRRALLIVDEAQFVGKCAGRTAHALQHPGRPFRAVPEFPC